MPRPIAKQVAELKARKEAIEKRLASHEHRQRSLTRKQATKRFLGRKILALNKKVGLRWSIANTTRTSEQNATAYTMTT